MDRLRADKNFGISGWNFSGAMSGGVSEEGGSVHMPLTVWYFPAKYIYSESAFNSWYVYDKFKQANKY